jgi:hypothetical protein
MPRWVGGVKSWIEDHCHGYTVQDFEHYLPYDCNPWKMETFRYIRGELEECENVLMVLYWPVPDVWRVVTWNSIVNHVLPNGRYMCDFYDPATNTYEWGELDPLTGYVHNYTGLLGDTPWVYKTLIISPVWADWKSPPPGDSPPVIVNYTGGPIAVPEPDDGTKFPCGDWLMRVIVKNHDDNVCVHKIVVVWHQTAGVGDKHGDMPTMFQLGRNVPNPFSVSTELRYAVPSEAVVSLDIYDVQGKKVRNLVSGAVPAGYHTAVWDGKDNQKRPVAPGIYYARMVSGSFAGTAKLMYLK